MTAGKLDRIIAPLQKTGTCPPRNPKYTPDLRLLGTVNLDGGTLETDSLDGPLDWTAGTLRFHNDLTIDTAGGTTPATSMITVEASTATSSETHVIELTITSLPPVFIRGDANLDGFGDIGDAITCLVALFQGTVSLDCEDSADVNDDGGVDISDPVALLNYLFRGQGTIPAPVPTCGVDPTSDALGCDSYPACP